MASGPRSPKPVRAGFYRIDLNRDTWIVRERYQDMAPIGYGGFSTVWLENVTIIILIVLMQAHYYSQYVASVCNISIYLSFSLSVVQL